MNRELPSLPRPSALASWALPAACALGAAAVALGHLDPTLFRVVNGWGPGHEALWTNLTMFGEGYVVLALFAFAIGRRPALLWAGVLGGLVALAASHALKDLASVDRPARVLDGVHVIGELLKRRSFPSGHTTTAFTAAGLLVLGGAPRVLRMAAVPAAAAVALSRLAVGAHWPTDVLVGAALGWCCARAAIWAGQRWPGGARGRARLVVAGLPPVAGAVLCALGALDPAAPLLQWVVAACGLVVGGRRWLAEWQGGEAAQAPSRDPSPRPRSGKGPAKTGPLR